jgi:hypothetical protein
MNQVCPVGEPIFTSWQSPTMNNFNIFSSGVVRSSNSISANVMFKCWVNHLKNVSHKWRVEKKVRRELPPSAHIQLSLDTTTLWCGVIGGPTPEELEYQPTKYQIF